MKIFLAGNTIFPVYIAPILLGGGGPDVDETISGKPAHPTKIPERPANVSNPVRGGGGLSPDEDISCGPGRMREERDQCDCSWPGSPHGGVGGGYDPIIREHKPFILESFFYADSDTERLLPYYGDFMLDSGAFTFMQQAGKDTDWNEYASRYVDFINRNDVKKYIELDLDYIIGCEGARKLRRFLEKKTGKQSIPVWHPIRGKDEFLRMCDEYDYVCLGGIVGQKWRGVEQYMPWFIREAHKRHTKIHGLGFTKLTKLPEYHFDSVDSTAWTTGNRFGYLYFFDGKTMIKKDVPKGYRLADSRAVALHNYSEWIKFQKWAETHL